MTEKNRSWTGLFFRYPLQRRCSKAANVTLSKEQPYTDDANATPTGRHRWSREIGPAAPTRYPGLTPNQAPIPRIIGVGIQAYTLSQPRRIMYGGLLFLLDQS
jgi:hypothetical protein